MEMKIPSGAGTTQGTYGHMGEMLRILKYCVIKTKHGLTLMHSTKWNGDHSFELSIRGKSDSNYVKCPDTRKSVGEYIEFLCDAVVTVKSVKQRIVALSTS